MASRKCEKNVTIHYIHIVLDAKRPSLLHYLNAALLPIEI
jgi:hypothetical protein